MIVTGNPDITATNAQHNKGIHMNAIARPANETFSADWRTFESTHRLRKVKILADNLETTWDDDRISSYHFLWLRDNCPCPRCVHPGTREQMFEVVDAPDDLAAESVSLDAAGTLNVHWSDGHRSVYEAGWLRFHAYDATSRSERADRLRSVRPWESNLVIPTFDYSCVMSSDPVLLDWLLAARDVGLTMLDDMPATDEAVENVARRISFIRESNFGITFEVRTKAEAADSNAYTSLELPAHTDLPTRELQPGLQFLHCLINDATGGESTFVDGFAIAAALRAGSPEDFRLLCEHPVEFWNKALQSDYRSLAPIIGLDSRGEVSEIRLANWLRAPFNLPASEMGAFYRAYRHFSALTRDSRFIVSRRLEAGQMWCFDNRRTMHARKAFDQASGKRFLRGCYMDRDELLSRILVLQRGNAHPSIPAA